MAEHDLRTEDSARVVALERFRFTWSVVILRGCAATQAGRLWSGIQSILRDTPEVNLLSILYSSTKSAISRAR